MSKIQNEIFLNLNDIKLAGRVLDMGYEGKGIIYRVLKNSISSLNHEEAAATLDRLAETQDCNWIYGSPDHMPFIDSSYDTVTAFFSFSYIRKKYIGNRIIKEISRVLSGSGKLYLWDINIKFSDIFLKRKISVKFPDSSYESYEINEFSFGRRFNINYIIPFIERYFVINQAKDMGNFFYIEAVKR